MNVSTLRYGSSARPRHGETVSGDRVAVLERADRTVVIVADGVGHGPEAAAAAERAVACIAESNATDPALALLECDQTLARTRGAAIALLWILSNRSDVLFAAVGNIAVAGATAHPLRMISKPGIVGARIRRPSPSLHRMEHGDVLILHSDGISRRFIPEHYRSLAPQEASDRLLEDHGLPYDDASCVVVHF